MNAVDAIASVQARIGSIEQRLGIARPAASATVSATDASSTVGTSTVDTSTVGGIDLSGSFEDVAASIEAATGTLSSSTPYADLFRQAGATYGIDPTVLAGVAYVESRFQTDVVSSAGAVGMMQFMPSTAASLGVDPRDPASAIDGAAQYLRSQIDRFGSVELALAAYNVGPGAVANAGGIQPGSQAEKYVSAVRAAMGRV